jgi:hypothetical protein
MALELHCHCLEINVQKHVLISVKAECQVCVCFISSLTQTAVEENDRLCRVAEWHNMLFANVLTHYNGARLS